MAESSETGSGNGHGSGSAASNTSVQARQISVDLGTMIRRHPWIFLTAMALSIGVGILYFLYAPRTYESVAQVLVEAKRSPTLSSKSVSDRSLENRKSLETHMRIVTGRVIIENALAQLAEAGVELPTLEDEKHPIDFVINNLEVYEETEGSSVMTVSYRGRDEDDCHALIGAIMGCYQKFLKESTKTVSDEATALITQAKDELMDSVTEKEAAYNEFRQSTPLLWDRGESINPHQQRQIQVENSRMNLAIKRSELVSKLHTLDQDIASGRSNAALFQAMGETLANNADARVDEQVMDRETLRKLAEDYTGLLREYAQLQDDYGVGHPDVVSMRKQVKVLKRQMYETQERLIPTASPRDPRIGVDYIVVYRNSLKAQIDALDQQIAELDGIYEEENKRAHDLQVFQVKDEMLYKDLERRQALFSAVLARLDEINIVRDHGGDRISMLAHPEVGKKVAPNLIRCLAGSLLSGALLGLGLVYLVDRSEATFRNGSEIRSALQLPIVGQIPMVSRKRLIKANPDCQDYDQTLVSVHQHNSPAAEAFRAIRTSIFFSAAATRQQVIQVTSPWPADGKSTVAANLAVTIAKSGKRVLLIDADFHKPTIHDLFGMEPSDALAQAIVGNMDPCEIERETKIDNLFVVGSGRRPDHPSELLTSVGFKELLDAMRERFEFIVVDTPPVLAVTDAAAVSARTDGSLLVLRIRRGVQAASTAARDVLFNVGANVLGVVVNAVDDTSKFREGSYGYGYGYGYGFGYGSPYGEKYGREPDTEIRPAPQLALQISDEPLSTPEE